MDRLLEQLVERLRAAAGENLDSIVLYGSAAAGDFHQDYSDLNLLCLLRDTSARALKPLAEVLAWWSGKLRHRPPLFMTEEELRTSADVFAIETLDIKGRHRLLAGRDILPEIEVPMTLHRVQLEHELRTLQLKLRQHYLLTPAEGELKKAIAKSISTVVTLLRHALIAMGRPVPEGKRAVVTEIGRVFAMDTGAFEAALGLREGGANESVETLYQRYLDAVSVVVHHVDQLENKSEGL